MPAGAITGRGYVTNPGDDHRHVLGNSGAHAVIVSTAALAARVIPAAEQVPSVRFAIAMESLDEPGAEPATALPVPGWDEAMAARAPHPGEIPERVAGLSPED